MAHKKRKVTFDPEEQPSLQSQPLDLLYADYPPVVSQQHSADIVCPASPSKSILKNPPVGDRGYENLCNILFDLPPPPEDNLLSIDNIFQTETVFKPGNNFARLKLESIRALEEALGKVEEEEEDLTQLASEENLDDAHLLFDVEQEKNAYTESEDPNTKQSRVNLLNDNDSDWLSDLSEIIVVESPDSEADSILTNACSESEAADSEAQGRVHDIIQIDRTELNCPLQSQVGDFEEVVHDIYSDENSIETSVNESVSFIEPLSRENSFEENSNPNIRKLDDTSIEELTEAEIVRKKNKTSVRNLSSQSTPTPETISNDNTTSLSSEEVINNVICNNSYIEICPEVSSESLSQNINDKVALKDPIDTLSLSNLSSLISPPTSIEHTETHEVEESLQSNTLIQNSFSIDTSELQRNELVDSQIRLISSDADLQRLNSSDTGENTVPTTHTKHKKKSEKKSHTHRKHSHSKKSKHKKQEVAPSPHLVHLETSEKRSAEARARFQRYLNKMSAKNTNENVNLNCAGEPETLEPHMRDSIKESEVLIWIYNMIDEVARVDYEFFLKDGCMLCKLMNRIVPGSIPEISRDQPKSKQTNVANFLKAAEAYGVAKAKLFFPEDLLQLRHVPRVTRCLYALAKQVREDPSTAPETPALGDEPSFLAGKSRAVVVPGHRDTSEVLASLAARSGPEEAGEKRTKHSLLR